MNTLFRFIQRRPVEKVVGAVSISIVTESSFQDELRETSTFDEIKAVAQTYYGSDDFVHNTEDLAYSDQILRFTGRAGEISNVVGLAKLTAEIFRPNVKTIVEDDDFETSFRRTADTIVALKILSKRHDEIDRLTNLLRGIGLLRRIAVDDSSLSLPNAVHKSLQATVVLPADVFSVDMPITKPKSAPVEKPTTKAKEPNPLDAANNMELTLRELLRVSSTDLESPSREEDSKIQAQTPKSDIVVSAQPPRFKPNAIERLSSLAKASLEEIGIDLRETSWRDAVNHTRRALNARIDELSMTELAYTSEAPTYAPDPSPPVVEVAMPYAPGNIRPAGIGDLIVVKQQIKQYEEGEVAHIENILKSEYKERTHIRREYLETMTTVELEAETERERDQQFTERSEMERETTKTIEEESSLKAGATISVSYGSFVEFTGSVEYETHEATEESTRQASSYAREIVEKSAERVSERIREERVRKVINEIEETNKHIFDNKKGRDHIVGVYQWVDKVYEAQAFKYDQRLLFDVIVPEPGMFLAQALAEKLPEGVVPDKPRKFSHTADQITETNYCRLAHRYGAVVNPPPQDYITEVKGFKHISQEDGQGTNVFSTTAEIEVEKDYKAVYVSVRHDIREDDAYLGDHYLMAWIGDRIVVATTEADSEWRLGDLGGEVGEIAAGITSEGIKTFALTCEITCVRTETAFRQWQLDTHASIMTAYLNQKTVYEQALEAALVEQGTVILGRNPAENRKLERDELKKFVLSMLTGQDFRSFGAIESSPSPGEGYPQPDIERAVEQGPYIRFFEQAFEWVNMMYMLYPYFWGRKDDWENKLQTEGADPEYVDFIRAGSARVVLPVRPGFEQAILHFLETGEIWSGGPVPDITSPLYLAIVEEIKERSGETSEQPVPYGAPWEVRLPTSLIKLRTNSDLPRWEKQDDGSWQPV